MTDASQPRSWLIALTAALLFKEPLECESVAIFRPRGVVPRIVRQGGLFTVHGPPEKSFTARSPPCATAIGRALRSSTHIDPRTILRDKADRPVNILPPTALPIRDLIG